MKKNSQLTHKEKLEFCYQYLNSEIKVEQLDQFMCLALNRYMDSKGSKYEPRSDYDYLPAHYFEEMFLFNPYDYNDEMQCIVANPMATPYQNNELRILIVCFIVAMLENGSGEDKNVRPVEEDDYYKRNSISTVSGVGIQKL